MAVMRSITRSEMRRSPLRLAFHDSIPEVWQIRGEHANRDATEGASYFWWLT